MLFDPIHPHKKPSETCVVVAMSGGVDSSVAAALMVEAGYNVIGMTMQLYDQGEMALKKKACCAGIDIYDAKQVAEKLGIPHYVLNYESLFKQSVIDSFVESYLSGETPIPCVRCNQTVKFRDMYATARELGADALVTGHYVQRKEENDKVSLHRAIDFNRDQSYFLFTTTYEQLQFLRFPLGGLEKSVTRDHARRFGLEVAEKPDSQDICFVPNGNYAEIVERLRPDARTAGEIVSVDGTKLGEHTGIINYTIGQRRGLGVAHSEPLYVVAINPEKHQVIVGPKEALGCVSLILKEVNWIDDAYPLNTCLEVTVKIRSSQEPIPALIQLCDNHQALVKFKEAEYGVSPGQACVFYNGTRVLGGGWIQETARATASM